MRLYFALPSIGFCLGRDWLGSRWYHWRAALGIGRCTDPNRSSRYRVVWYFDFWLIPNFIWYRDFLGIENGRPVFQDRIVGVHGWPHSFYRM